jgi:hypothetical protein
MAITTGFTQANNGFWYRTSDGSGPYICTGTNMVLAGGGALVGLSGGQSQKLELAGGVSSPSAAIGASFATLLVDVPAFFRVGAAPVAVVNGTDQYIPANQLFRIGPFAATDKIAVIAAEVGNAYISPGA